MTDPAAPGASGPPALPPRLPPIGVFDSGVGGLTVLRALRLALPAEDFIYLGDTARLPYGTKSSSTVERYSAQCADSLVARGIRCLVVACNTASAFALDALRRRYPAIPVIGVIEPGAAAAVAVSVSQRFAVIGTEGTIAGGAYQAAIRRLNPGARVAAVPCSLLVAMAEEGWTDGPIATAVARRYLEPLFHAASMRATGGAADAGDLRGASDLRGGVHLRGVGQERGAVEGRGIGDLRGDGEGGASLGIPDTLLLGCTHFPVFTPVLQSVVPPGVRIVDSAATAAAAVTQRLVDRTDTRHPAGGVRWLATDGAARFARVSGVFLGSALRPDAIEIIDL